MPLRSWVATLFLGSLVALSASSAGAASLPSSQLGLAQLVGASQNWYSRDPATYTNAKRAFEDIRSKYPGTLESELAYVELQRLRWLQGESATVSAELKVWLTGGASPEARAHALRYLGDSSAASGDAAKAEELCKQSIVLAGRHLVAGLTSLRLAELYLTVGRKMDAYILYRQTASDYAGSLIEAQIRREWAAALTNGSEDDSAYLEAGNVLSPTMQASPSSREVRAAWVSLIEAQVVASKTDDALKLCLRLLTEAPGTKEALTAEYYAGYIEAVIKEQPTSAIPRLKHVLAVETDRDHLAWARHRLGHCYLLLRDYSAARAEFLEVTRGYPGTIPARCAQSSLDLVTALQIKEAGASEN